MAKKFIITYEVNHAYSIEDIWPDGDAPENPTVADVKKVLDECGSVEQVVLDWEMIDPCAKFSVYEFRTP